MKKVKIKFRLIKCLSLFIVVSFLLSTISFAQPDIKDNLYRNVNYEWLSNVILPASASYYDDDISMNPFISVLEGYASNYTSLNKNSEILKATDVYIALKDYNSRNALGIKPLESYFKQIDSINSLNDFAVVCASLTKSGFDILNIRYLPKNNIPTIKLMDFNLDIYFPDSYNSNYEAYLKKLFSLTGSNNVHVTVDNVIGLERVLAKHSDQNHYNEINGEDFKKLIEQSKTNNFATQFQNIFSQQLGINNNVKFSLKKDLICQLQVIKNMDIPILKNFLKSTILRNSAGFLTQDIENCWVAHKNYVGLNKNDLYSKMLKSSLGFCRLYGKGLIENISSADKVFVSDIFKKVKTQYITDLKKLNLQSEEKVEKYVNDIKTSYGVPLDFEAGIEYPIISKNSLLSNILALNEFNTAVCVAKCNKGQLLNITQEKTYLLAGVDPNMAYDSFNHSVIFCPLIFNSSRYNNSLPEKEKWLAMAFTIAHEIGHSLDSRNIPNLAKKYNLSTSDVQVLSKFFQPIANQISSYSINISGNYYNMNPTRVLFEAIADVYGAETVVKIIKKEGNVTLDEFFRVYAKMRRSVETDEKLKLIIEREFHPVNEYRVNKTIANLNELYETYNIGDVNGMYIAPENRAKR